MYLRALLNSNCFDNLILSPQFTQKLFEDSPITYPILPSILATMLTKSKDPSVLQAIFESKHFNLISPELLWTMVRNDNQSQYTENFLVFELSKLDYSDHLNQTFQWLLNNPEDGKLISTQSIEAILAWANKTNSVAIALTLLTKGYLKLLPKHAISRRLGNL